ncbi:MAG: hypothetical protein ROO73_01045 [Roseivirga sp.]
MTKINLDLDVQEVNIIIKSLSERPFREVYELIGKIHAQSNVQLPSHGFQDAKPPKNKGD